MQQQLGMWEAAEHSDSTDFTGQSGPEALQVPMTPMRTPSSDQL